MTLKSFTPTFLPVKNSLKSLRTSKVLTSSSLLIGTGYLTWQVYSYLSLDTSHIEDSEYLKPPFEEDEDIQFQRLHQPQWKFLRESNSRNSRLQGRAIKELHKMKHLNSGVMTQIAQSLSMEAAIALARYPHTDPRFFLRPPPLPTEVMQKTSQRLFADVLSSLPEGGASGSKSQYHPCIDKFTRDALNDYVPNSDDEVVRDSDLANEFHRESHHIYAIPRKRISEEMLIEYCLIALLSHSTLQHHCQILLENTLFLPLLQRLLREYPQSPKVKCLIGKIIANMSQYPEFHKSLFTSGWVGLLAAWKEDPNLLISLPATKALANMDQEYLKHKYEPGIYLMQYPKDRNIDAEVDVVFIHGLLGGVFFSWRQGDPKNERGWGSTNLISSKDYSVCWPRDWIQDDLDSEVRILGVDFDTYLSQWGGPCPNESFSSTLQERSADILRKLKESGVGQKARRVILVGHSMGGIIIKNMLLLASASADEEDSNLVKNLRGILFFGTPHQGSDVASLNATSRFLFFPSTEVSELASGSPILTSIHSNFLEWVKNRSKEQGPLKIVSFGESETTPYMGFDFTFVSEKSSNPGIGEFYAIKSNHLNICKPDSKKSILYRKLLSMLWEATDENL